MFIITTPLSLTNLSSLSHCHYTLFSNCKYFEDNCPGHGSVLARPRTDILSTAEDSGKVWQGRNYRNLSNCPSRRNRKHLLPEKEKHFPQRWLHGQCLVWPSSRKAIFQLRTRLQTSLLFSLPPPKLNLIVGSFGVTFSYEENGSFLNTKFKT